MDARAALRELEALGTAKNRQVYARHGVDGPAFGVSYADLGKLKKKIGTDHALALELWKSGNHDARVLATMIVDPARLDRKTVEGWSRNLENYVLTDAVAGAVAPSPCAADLARDWIETKSEWKSSAGWNLIARGAALPGSYDRAELGGFLELIEARIHSSPNRTRYTMNSALIAIGLASPELQARALAAAKRIGAVEVDHGETGCKTPDAASYILKAASHRAARAAKPMRAAASDQKAAKGKPPAKQNAARRARR